MLSIVDKDPRIEPPIHAEYILFSGARSERIFGLILLSSCSSLGTSPFVRVVPPDRTTLRWMMSRKSGAHLWKTEDKSTNVFSGGYAFKDRTIRVVLFWVTKTWLCHAAQVGQCWMGCFNEPNTIPSPKPKFCPNREVSVNVGLQVG